MSTANILAKVNKANNFALSLLKSQRSILETISENGWHSIADLTIGKHYKLAKQNNSWIVQQGEEKVFNEKPPVAQWNFDEGTGTTAYDNVGTNNGTLVSSPTWQTSSNCVNGSCLGFNGSSNYVNAGNSASLNIITAVTLSSWIKFNSSTQDWCTVAGKGFETTANYSFDANSNWVRLNTGNGSSYYSGSNLRYYPTLNEWFHMVGVYTTIGSTTRLDLYINGSFYATDTVAWPLTITAANFGIGRSDYATSFNGLVDEVLVYDYALNANQIKQHYNAGLNRLGLISQWGMDEGNGLTAYDYQGVHNGNLSNGPTWKLGTNCVSGGCLDFDGVDDYVTAGTGNDYFPLPLFSICTWAKSSGLAAGQVRNGIFSLTYGLTLSLNGSGYFRTEMTNGPTGQVLLTADNLYDNNFHHLCLTFNGTSRYMYVDGVLKNSAVTTWLGTTDWPTIDCRIGLDINDFNTLRFKGTIDDIRFYNRALSADEIANQYKDGYTKYFYVNNVSRDIASDPTASTHNLETTYNANHDDTNTKKITNVTRYLLGTPGRVNTQEQYLARASNINSLIQTDWSGSSGVAGPEIDFGNNYFSSSNLTLSTAGQMSLTSAASNGNLISSIIDTQSINGSGYFNLLWQGDALCSGCSVKFQIAASNSNAGPWTYYGPTSTSDYYTPSGPNIPVPITYAGQYSALSSSVQNKRYIRYQITLVPASSTSPVIKDVIINYAP